VAASSGPEDDDPLREAKAYNASIYLMLTMPYALLGGLGFLIYRSTKGQKSGKASGESESAEDADAPPPLG
jgi:hypothetical protein